MRGWGRNLGSGCQHLQPGGGVQHADLGVLSHRRNMCPGHMQQLVLRCSWRHRIPLGGSMWFSRGRVPPVATEVLLLRWNVRRRPDPGGMRRDGRLWLARNSAVWRIPVPVDRAMLFQRRIMPRHHRRLLHQRRGHVAWPWDELCDRRLPPTGRLLSARSHVPGSR